MQFVEASEVGDLASVQRGRVKWQRTLNVRAAQRRRRRQQQAVQFCV
eukprot:COSAG05_NODE_256_length_12752_cov_5.614795_2_plen_47_part_00